MQRSLLHRVKLVQACTGEDEYTSVPYSSLKEGRRSIGLSGLQGEGGNRMEDLFNIIYITCKSVPLCEK